MLQGIKVKHTTAERDIYFFHSDHLGSTAYLTDRDGALTQFVCYMPYGEAFVDEHTTDYENPYKFSGKELDNITGLYDHGARSRDPKITMWYAVDPLFVKYTDMSPYVYCAGNPVRFVDPDGRDSTSFLSNLTISIGGQYGWNWFNVISAEINLGSMELFSVFYTEKGNSESTIIDYAGKNGVKVKQNLGVGAGIPFVGDATALVQNSFKAYDGYAKSDEKETGVSVDVAKLSFSLKCIIGIEGELNYNFTDGNTFLSAWDMLMEILGDNQSEQKNENKKINNHE